MCILCRSRVYACTRVRVRMHSQHAGVRRLVTCTCQNQYLASLGYDNVAVCVLQSSLLVYIHAYMHSICIHACIAYMVYGAGVMRWAAHASGTICRISRNFRIALVTRGVNNVYAPKLFPSRNGGRASRCAFIGRF